ncbi:MAG: amino acid ABC transporter ATP-binding protein [Lachnospiraceae bacterium]|nr:amino acid ABC transporter ATP-binding protein [Lachnospiraceae bacterium]
MSLIEIKGLCKSFGSLEVLKDVNLTVEEGEVIAIIGGSGCGKSVSLRCMELLETPDAGQIIIDGMEITAKGADIDKIRCSMGMVYQNFNLFTHMNVMDNLCLAPVRLRKMNREDAEKKARDLLNQVGLSEKENAMPANLSGGQKQRIAIARCLMMDPKIMLFDEPTSALDPTMVGEVLATMRGLAKKEMTMLIVTHEMNFAKEIADRVLFFADKGIYEQGTPQEIFENPQKERTISFIKKLKFFNYHITDRNFDLMAIQGGIYDFMNRYGLGHKTANRLQLCTEELIYPIMEQNADHIDIEISIEYSEADKSILLICTSVGASFNPFESETDDSIEDNLSITILKNMTKHYTHSYKDGKNILHIEI